MAFALTVPFRMPQVSTLESDAFPNTPNSGDCASQFSCNVGPTTQKPDQKEKHKANGFERDTRADDGNAGPADERNRRISVVKKKH